MLSPREVEAALMELLLDLGESPHDLDESGHLSEAAQGRLERIRELAENPDAVAKLLGDDGGWEEEEDEPPAAPARMATAHAPVGGADIAGHHFQGGQFVPAAVMAQAGAAELHQLEGDDANDLAPEVSSAIDGWFAESDLPPEKAGAYRDAARSVLSSMPKGAARRFLANVERVRFVPSVRDVTAEYTKLAGRTPSDTVGGLWSFFPGDPQGEIVVDGGADTGEKYYSGGHSAEDMRGIYSHEFWHAVDGTQNEISQARAWYRAWMDEIARPEAPLSRYARKSPREGLAEMGRLIVAAPDVARQRFPACWAYLESRGLV